MFWDPPYGVTEWPWDVVLSKEQLEKVLLGLKVINHNVDYQMFMYNHFLQVPLVHDVLVAAGAQTVHPIFVSKPQQNVTGVNTYIFNTEIVVRATFSATRANVVFQTMNANPLMRHNAIMVPNTPKLKNPATGQVINTTQKSPQFAELMTARHCRPGGNVLVLGGGAGGDADGAIRQGANVVIFESDPDQCAAMMAKYQGWKDAGSFDNPEHPCHTPNESLFVPASMPRMAKDGTDRFIEGVDLCAAVLLSDMPAEEKAPKKAKAKAKAKSPHKSKSKAEVEEPDVKCAACGQLKEGASVQQCAKCKVVCHVECMDPQHAGDKAPLVCSKACMDRPVPKK